MPWGDHPLGLKIKLNPNPAELTTERTEEEQMKVGTEGTQAARVAARESGKGSPSGAR
jgi:hypothetical protein